MSFMEEVRMMVVNGESGCRLQRKWRSFKEKVGRVVVNIEIGERLQRMWEWWSLKENWWLWSLMGKQMSFTEKVEVI